MTKKNDFKPFKVGTIFNPLGKKFSKLSPSFRSIEIMFPSRLNAMALDPSKITSNCNLIYSPGEIIFKVKLYKKVLVKIYDQAGGIEVSKRTERIPLVLHSALLMKNALGFSNKIFIDVDNQNEIKHIGLGSSSGLIAAVACCINELFSKPIDSAALLRYVAQNHGEEIDNNCHDLYPVQCIGGSAAAGLYDGSMIVLAGENTVISSMCIDNKYKAVIGIPLDFEKRDSQDLMEDEIKYFPKFLECGQKFGSHIAYRMLHEVLPAMKIGDLATIGNLIYDYRFKMGSIENCSYCYKKLPELARKISLLKVNKNADILSISSVGPAFFAITKDYAICEQTFKENNMSTLIVEMDNKSYEIINKEEFAQ